MIRATAAVLGLVGVLVLGACGGGSDADAADAIAEGLMAENDETFELQQEQADCVGEGFVDEIGVDKLQEYGIITDELEASDTSLDVKLERADAESAAAVLVDCTDAEQLFQDAMQVGEELPAEVQTCLEDALTEDMLEAFFTATFTQDEEAMTAAMEPVIACQAG